MKDNEAKSCRMFICWNFFFMQTHVYMCTALQKNHVQASRVSLGVILCIYSVIKSILFVPI